MEYYGAMELMKRKQHKCTPCYKNKTKIESNPMTKILNPIYISYSTQLLKWYSDMNLNICKQEKELLMNRLCKHRNNYMKKRKKNFLMLYLNMIQCWQRKSGFRKLLNYKIGFLNRSRLGRSWDTRLICEI